MFKQLKRAMMAARIPALLAAGGLVAGAGMAREQLPSKKPSKPTPAAVAETSQKSATTASSDPAARIEEIKVRLAWIGDELTCPWPLQAKAVGRIIQVSGETPTLAAHEQALKVARQSTQLLVVDGIRVNAAMPAPQAGGSIDQMLSGVFESLHKALGDKADKIEVASASDGRITLRGSVASYEEKLKLSDTLRQVKGCTSVVNLLNVAPVVRGDSAILPVSADAESSVPVSGGPVSSEPATPTMKTDVPRRLPSGVESAPAMKTPPVVANTEKQKSAQAPIATSKTRPELWSRSSYAPARNGVAQYEAAVHSTTVPVAYKTSVEQGSNVDEKPPVKKKRFVGIFAQDKDKDTSKSSASKSQAAKDAPKPLPANMQKNQKSTVAVASNIPATAADQPVHPAKQTITSTQLRQKVLTACGGLSRDVSIQVQADKTVNVLVKVPNAQAEQQVVERVLKMPEMMAPNVQLSIEVAAPAKK